MEKLFYKKGTSILIIAMVLVVVILLCMLLTFLAQEAAFKQKTEYINRLIDQAEQDVETQKKIIEYTFSLLQSTARFLYSSIHHTRPQYFLSLEHICISVYSLH